MDMSIVEQDYFRTKRAALSQHRVTVGILLILLHSFNANIDFFFHPVSNNAISTASLVILGAVALLILCLMASMVCFCRRRKARLRRARNQDDCQVVSTLPIPHHAGEGMYIH